MDIHLHHSWKCLACKPLELFSHAGDGTVYTSRITCTVDICEKVLQVMCIITFTDICQLAIDVLAVWFQFIGFLHYNYLVTNFCLKLLSIVMD